MQVYNPSQLCVFYISFMLAPQTLFYTHMHFPVEYWCSRLYIIDKVNKLCQRPTGHTASTLYFNRLREMQPCVEEFIDLYAHRKRSPFTIISGDDVTPLKRAISVHLVLIYEKHTGPMSRPNS